MVVEVRCPYCNGDGSSPPTMVKNTHDEYVCRSCGHVETLNLRESRCSCVRCLRESEAHRLKGTRWPTQSPRSVLFRP